MRCRVGLPAGAAFCPKCGAGTTVGAVAGPVLDGYTVLGVLGHGGASVVYLARQEALDRQVAVKVLRHDVEDERAWRRFRREAQAIASLSAHPNVVTVYTAGRMASGEHYLVTEYLDRGSLSDVVAGHGRLAPDEVASVGIAVATRAGCCPRARDRPPRRQAGQRAAQPPRSGQARRLRDRPPARGAVGDPHRRHRLYARARRTGDPSRRAGRAVERRLRPRVDVGDRAHRDASVHSPARRASRRVPVPQAHRAAGRTPGIGTAGARRTDRGSTRSGTVAAAIAARVS